MKSLLSPIFLTFCVPPLGIPQQFASTGTGNFLLSPRRDRPAVWLQMSHFDELDDGAMYLQNSPDPYWLFRTRQSGKQHIHRLSLVVYVCICIARESPQGHQEEEEERENMSHFNSLYRTWQIMDASAKFGEKPLQWRS